MKKVIFSIVEELEKKLLNFAQHYEFELSGIKINDIKYHKVKFKNITKNNSNSINSLMLLLPKKLNSELEKGDP